jgi:cytochrome c oxidase cbb3-type subunit 3
MSRDTNEILGHADEADGIEEYDNPLPDWWLGMFWGCILWGLLYGAEYHFVSGRSQAGAYDAEMAAAQQQWPNLNKSADFDDSPETLAVGQQVFASTCVGCHGVDLRGGIGPNLIDTAWIHGGDYASIVKTITEGVPAKGMVAWGPTLGPKKIAAVSSYLLHSNTGEAPAVPATDAAPSEPTPEAAADAAPADPLAHGEKVFSTHCVACHQADMTGGVGPNLIDGEWIHGGELNQITATITNGVPAKGMITWKGVLSDQEINNVAAYIYSKSHPAAAE